MTFYTHHRYIPCCKKTKKKKKCLKRIFFTKWLEKFSHPSSRISRWLNKKNARNAFTFYYLKQFLFIYEKLLFHFTLNDDKFLSFEKAIILITRLWQKFCVYKSPYSTHICRKVIDSRKSSFWTH